jgi:cytosine/adenosine deaminase-related metal-dependent hydrolase
MDRRYSRKVIVRARLIVTMNGPPIENGAVAIEGNRIVDVGLFNEVKARHSDEIIDLGEQALIPGLINAHCHLEYTMLRDKIPAQPSFTEWIRQINAQKAGMSAEDYLRAIAAGLAEAQRWGTTAIANVEAFPELVLRVPLPQLRTFWFSELIDVRSSSRPRDLIAAALSSSEGRANAKIRFGLSPHAPFTASAELYWLAAERARREGILLMTHLAESREEMQMFRDGDGPLFEFLKSIGRPMQDCGSETPLAFMLNRHELDEDWIVVHLNELTEDDFTLLARRPRFHIVHCPRSHAYFRHSPFVLGRLRQLGFNICLGTDSLASNTSLSLFAEMQSLQRTFPSLPPYQVLEMVTVNAAQALHQKNELGRLRTGYYADLIAVPSDGKVGDVFEEVIGFNEPVSWMMVDGQRLVAS